MLFVVAFGPYPKAAAFRCQSKSAVFWRLHCCEKIKAPRQSKWVIFDVPPFHFPFRRTPSRVRQILLGKLSGSSQLLRYFPKSLARLKTNLATNFSFPP